MQNRIKLRRILFTTHIPVGVMRRSEFPNRPLHPLRLYYMRMPTLSLAPSFAQLPLSVHPFLLINNQFGAVSALNTLLNDCKTILCCCRCRRRRGLQRWSCEAGEGGGRLFVGWRLWRGIAPHINIRVAMFLRFICYCLSDQVRMYAVSVAM